MLDDIKKKPFCELETKLFSDINSVHTADWNDISQYTQPLF